MFGASPTTGAEEHPGRQELLAYGQGRLASRWMARVERHLSSCPACRLAAAAAPDDSLMSRLRRNPSTEPSRHPN